MATNSNARILFYTRRRWESPHPNTTTIPWNKWPYYSEHSSLPALHYIIIISFKNHFHSLFLIKPLKFTRILIHFSISPLSPLTTRSSHLAVHPLQWRLLLKVTEEMSESVSLIPLKRSAFIFYSSMLYFLVFSCYDIFEFVLGVDFFCFKTRYTWFLANASGNLVCAVVVYRFELNMTFWCLFKLVWQLLILYVH